MPRRFNAGLGGWVATVPLAPAVDTRRRWSIVLAAGPVASLALAGVAVAAMPFVGSGVLFSLLLGLTIQSLYMGVFALLPSWRPGVTSDGAQLFALHRANADYRRNRPLIWLRTQLKYKVRLRELPDWMLADVAALVQAGAVDRVAIDSLELGRMLDQAPRDQALIRRSLEAYRAAHGDGAWLAACEAYYVAVAEQDPGRAAAILAASPKESDVAVMRHAAEAAIAAVAGDAVRTRALLRNMRAALVAASPFADPTFRDIEREITSVLAVSRAPVGR